MTEKLLKKLEQINKKFEENDFFIKEDIFELFENDNSLQERLENIKLKKIEFFVIFEENCIGFTLDDVQVNFFVKLGEDEIGKWYEVEVELIYF